MTDIAYDKDEDAEFSKISWEGVSSSSDGAAYTLKGQEGSFCSIHFTGSFTGDVSLKCSNDGTTWEDMYDADGNLILVTAATGLFTFQTAADQVMVDGSSMSSGTCDVFASFKG